MSLSWQELQGFSNGVAGASGVWSPQHHRRAKEDGASQLAGLSQMTIVKSFVATTITAGKDDAPAIDQAAIFNVAGMIPLS